MYTEGGKRKGVRFNDVGNKIYQVIHRMEISSEEHLAAFFTPEEYATMRLRDRIATRYPVQGGTTKYELGLESRRDRFLRRKRINECCLSVLLEQELQNTTTRNDSTALADVLRPFSIQSAKLAYWRAYNNAMQVHHDHEPESPCASDDENGNDHRDKDSARGEPRDRAASPTSAIDLTSCDCESPVKAMEIDPVVEDRVVDFLPPRTLMSRPPWSPVLTVNEMMPHHVAGRYGYTPSPVVPLVDPLTVRSIHYYHPLPQFPWMERWTHQFSSTTNAPEPIHPPMHWYLA